MIDFCILGSGLSGSTIAKLLSKKYSIEIIDKANGIGGRSSNKKLNKYVSFDHGLQYYSAKDNRFKKFLNQLIKKKILKVWEGNHIDFTFKKKEETRKVIGVNGNNDLNKYLLRNIKKKFGKEITRIKYKKTHWELLGKKLKFKAKNIIITFPFEQSKRLAREYLSQSFLNQKLKMKPNITLLIIQKNSHKMPVSSIRLNNKVISWIANENSKKRFFSKGTHWTIQTSDNYSKKIIKIFKKKKSYYSKQIIKEFSNVLGINYKNIKIFKIHGWKYSSSNNMTNKACYWDKKFRIGLCGDWFVGPKAESAWLSANNLFKSIKKNPPKF